MPLKKKKINNGEMVKFYRLYEIVLKTFQSLIIIFQVFYDHTLIIIIILMNKKLFKMYKMSRMNIKSNITQAKMVCILINLRLF